MCGLSGVAGSITVTTENVFKDLLVLHQLRGLDSTGAASIPRYEGQDIKFFKNVGPATDVVYYNKRFDKVLNGQHCVLMGHNRSATVGQVNQHNAHPFAFSNIIGMHNGSITEWESEKLIDPDNKFNTDSEALIHKIETVGPNILEDLIGAWALVWYDRKKHSLFMIRNEKRPLFWTLSTDKKLLFWGSEINLLLGAINRDGRDIKVDKTYLLTENILFQWKIPKDQQEFEDPVRTKLKGKDPLLLPSKGHNSSSNLIIGGKSNSSSDSSFFQKAITENGQKNGNRSLGTKVLQGEFAGLIAYIEGTEYRVYRDPIRNIWVTARWDKSLTFWNKVKTHHAPANLSYTLLDINSRHEFKHVGKKKKKTIFYMGWNDRYLNKDQFESLMLGGCASCSRVPEWGNKVEFVNAEDFLCEFCSLDTDLVNTWKGITSVENKSANNSGL